MNPLDQQQQARLYWWGTLIFFVLYTINSLTSAMMVSLVVTKWNLTSPQERFLIVIGIFQNWTGMVIAFLHGKLARIVKGQPLVETGDTEQITKKDT